MKSFIYLSSASIEIVGYEAGQRPRVLEAVSALLPEGCLMGGKITDPAAICEVLRQVQEQHPQLLESPTLLVDGNILFAKRLVVPRLKRIQYLKLIAEEFAGASEHPEELLCDYHSLPVGEDGKQSLLSFACEKQAIESYMALFGELGIKLSGIRLGLEALVKAVEAREDCCAQTCVVNLVDGISLLSLVFVRGVVVFISRTRLHYEGSAALARSLYENLSGLMQFNRSQQLPDIEAAYYLGLGTEELDFLHEHNPHPLPVLAFRPVQEPLGLEKLDERAHFLLLALDMGGKATDMLHNHHALPKLKKAQQPRNDKRLILLGLLSAVAIYLAVLTTQSLLLQGKIREHQSYLEDSAVVQKSEELGAIQQEINYYQKVTQQIAEREAAYEVRPALDNALLDFIVGTHANLITLGLLDYDAALERIQISGNCPQETDAAAYVEALKQNPRIVSVRYTGYQNLSVGEGKQSFQFGLEISLSDKGEKEEAAQ